MAITSDNIEVTTTTATVAVRIPVDGGAGLAEDAERRLSRVDGVRAAAVDGLQGLEPGLSATVVTVTVTIDSTVPVAELRERIAASSAVVDVEQLDGD